MGPLRATQWLKLWEKSVREHGAGAVAPQPNRLIEEIVKTQFFLDGTGQKFFVAPQLNGDIFSEILNEGGSCALGSFFFQQQKQFALERAPAIAPQRRASPLVPYA